MISFNTKGIPDSSRFFNRFQMNFSFNVKYNIIYSSTDTIMHEKHRSIVIFQVGDTRYRKYFNHLRVIIANRIDAFVKVRYFVVSCNFIINDHFQISNTP